MGSSALGTKRTWLDVRLESNFGPSGPLMTQAVWLSLQRPVPEATPWPLQCAKLSRHDPLSSARNVAQ
jgi:hypothetical protein